MKRFIMLFGVAVIAAVMFAATASAVEPTKILPEPTALAALTDKVAQTGSGRLLSVAGLEVKCSAGAGDEEFTSANNGNGEITFSGCTSALSTTCTQSGKGAGEIVAKGEVRFLLALEMLTGGGTALIGALVYTVSPAVTFICENKPKTIKNTVKVENNSCVAAKDLHLNALISEAEDEFTQWTSGETLILEILPANSTAEVKCLPTESLNGGAAELFALESKLKTKEYKKGGAALTIELMN